MAKRRAMDARALSPPESITRPLIFFRGKLTFISIPSALSSSKFSPPNSSFSSSSKSPFFFINLGYAFLEFNIKFRFQVGNKSPEGFGASRQILKLFCQENIPLFGLGKFLYNIFSAGARLFQPYFDPLYLLHSVMLFLTLLL